MKKITLLALFIIGFANAQIVNIPDANFMAELLYSNPDYHIVKDLDGNYISADANNDGVIQVSEAENISYLVISNKEISDITGIEAFVNLEIFTCFSNDITDLDVSQNVNLKSFICGYNPLGNLDVTQNVNLEFLICTNNNLSSLDVTQNISLIELVCHTNQLTSIDLSQNISLEQLLCWNNEMTTIDVSENINLDEFRCQNNELESLFIKNGKAESIINFSSNPNLTYVCSDENQRAYIQNEVGSNVMVNSYCSFTPGGDFNTILGTIFFDDENDGCDVNDLPQLNVRIDINDGFEQGTSFTNTNGFYNFFTGVGNYDLSPSIINTNWFNLSPTTSSVEFSNINNNTQQQNFCVTPIGVHNDVFVVMFPLEAARPGFDARYAIVYKNIGNQMLSGNIDLNFNDDILDFVTASIAPDSQNVNSLSWNYSNLLPFELRSIVFTLNVNSPMDTPAVNNGDILNFNVTITPDIDDETPLNNNFDYDQTVVGSYDPNDITCLEGEIINPERIGEYLHYNINFENTGTAAATFIVVRDEIDETQYDINSLQVLHSSHNMVTRITDNFVEFIFDDINLAAEGKGNVLFKIKTKADLVIGDSVSNKANIYFDYNFPIETNTATTVFDVLSVDEFSTETINVYPNPFENIVNVTSKSIIKYIQIYDVQGRLIESEQPEKTEAVIQILNLKNGIYFLKIKTIIGESLNKIIKN